MRNGAGIDPVSGNKTRLNSSGPPFFNLAILKDFNLRILFRLSLFSRLWNCENGCGLNFGGGSSAMGQPWEGYPFPEGAEDGNGGLDYDLLGSDNFFLLPTRREKDRNFWNGSLPHSDSGSKIHPQQNIGSAFERWAIIWTWEGVQCAVWFPLFLVLKCVSEQKMNSNWTGRKEKSVGILAFNIGYSQRKNVSHWNLANKFRCTTLCASF